MACQQPRKWLPTANIPFKRKSALSNVRVSATFAWSAPSSASVEVDIQSPSTNARLISAAVSILAPVDATWEALTAYDKLGSFIPGLIENKVLEYKKNGCLLSQVASRRLPVIGLPFTARCVLDVREHPDGFSRRDALLKVPATARRCIRSCAKDISFIAVGGDFQEFRGLWSMQRDEEDSRITNLVYTLYVAPHPWLPVALMTKQVSEEVAANLLAVKDYLEREREKQDCNA